MGNAFDFAIRLGQIVSTNPRTVVYSVLDNPFQCDFNKVIEVKSGTINFKLSALCTYAAVAGRQHFKTYDEIKIYASATAMDKSGTGEGLLAADLVFNGIIDYAELLRSSDKKYWEIEASDKTKVLYNFIWSRTYSASDGWKIWDEADPDKSIIKNLIDNVNTNYQQNFTTNNVAKTKSNGQPFDAIDLTGLQQPVGKWLETISADLYTNDGNYVIYVDNDDDLHFEKKSSTQILVLDADSPTVDYYQLKLSYSILDAVNYVIFDAGKDKNGASIYGYVLATESDGNFRPKFVSDTDIAKSILVSNPSIDNADLRTQARAQAAGKWQAFIGDSNGIYGQGRVQYNPLGLWVDSDVNGYLYPVYASGRIQKMEKNDVNVVSFPDTNLWVRANTNLYNFVFNPTKNVFYSNERPTFLFKAVDKNGIYIQADDNRLFSSQFYFTTINAFNEFTATESAYAQFMDPRILGSYNAMPVTSRNIATTANAYTFSPPNYMYFMNDGNDNILFYTTAGTGFCQTRMYPQQHLYGWHLGTRFCLYENVDLTEPTTLDHTQNGVFLTSTNYNLVTPKAWHDFPITKTFGTDNWAWLSDHNSMYNTVLGFATRFGKDQNESWTSNLGQAVAFSNYSAAGSYIYDYVDATLDFNNPIPSQQQWHESYFLFKNKGDGTDGNRHWQYVESDTNMIANPVLLSVSENQSGAFVIDSNTYSNRVDFNATEPGIMDRNSEPFWFDFNATGAIQPDCSDVLVTDTSDVPVGLWQVDANSCVADSNYTLFVQDSFSTSQTKSYRLYYNSTAHNVPQGFSDLNVFVVSGTCAAGTDTIDVNSQNWFSWTRPGLLTSETLRFNFDVNDSNNWFNGTATHYQMQICYPNSQSANTGAGSTTSTCGTVAATFTSRCYQRSFVNNKIFSRIDMNTANQTLTPHQGSTMTRKIMTRWYFFNNNGRVRVMSKLDMPLPVVTTGISQNLHPFYYWGTYGLVPQGTVNDDWFNWSGRKELMDAYTPVSYSADKTSAILTPSPLPLMFNIDYNGEHFLKDANASSASGKPGKGCTVHKVRSYLSWRPYGPTIATDATNSAATYYNTDFISCDSDLNTVIPPVGNDGYVNAFPKESIYGSSYNKFIDPNLTAKFYLKPNLYIPDNRENHWLPPGTWSTTNVTFNMYNLATAKLSSYILDVCPSEDYNYIGFSDFLQDIDNLTANDSTHLVTSNRTAIPCATSMMRFSTSTGSYGLFMIFQRDLNVIVAEITRPDVDTPYNLYNSSGDLDINGTLDYTVAQKTLFYMGKWFFTSSPDPWVISAYSTTGAEQLSGATRYAWAPSFLFNKKAYDESAFWNKADYNMIYLQSPCNLNGYGTAADFDMGPGWATGNWVICPGTAANIEKYSSFRPTRMSIYPATTTAIVTDNLLVIGRPNKTTLQTDLGVNAGYNAYHNSLWDYKHYSDYSQIIDSFSELNEGTKHSNKQAWHCDLSSAESKLFCFVPATTTTLIYSPTPGTLYNAWAYYQSDREMGYIRDYYWNKWLDTGAFNPVTDFITERVIYPMLSESEVTFDTLYTSNDVSDYNLFRTIVPKMYEASYQSQFMLKDWKNTVFMLLSNDSRAFQRDDNFTILGVPVKNKALIPQGENIALSVFKAGSGTAISSMSATIDENSQFSSSYSIPSDLNAGVYYIKADYNGGEITGTVSFQIYTLSIALTTDKSSFQPGETVNFTAVLTDTTTEELINDATAQISITSPSGVALESGYMAFQSAGTYTYNYALDSSAPLGAYSVVIDAARSNANGKTTKQLTVAIPDVNNVTQTVTTTVTTYLSGGSSGAGGGGGSSFQSKTLFSSRQEIVELMHGKSTSFEIKITNPLQDANITDLNFKITGALAKYVKVVPDHLARLDSNESATLKIMITSASYFSVGVQELKLITYGNAVEKAGTNKFNEEIDISLEIHDFSRQDAEKRLASAKTVLEKIRAVGIYMGTMDMMYDDAESLIGQRKYEQAIEISDSILNFEQQLRDANSSIAALDKKMQEANSRGIDTFETKKLLNLATLAMQRAEFSNASQIMKEAELTFALETKGEVNAFVVLAQNPVPTAAGIVVLVILAIIAWFANRYIWLSRKIKKLKAEESILLFMIKDEQKKCFIDAKSSLNQYFEANEQHERRLSEVITELTKYENKLRGLFSFLNPKKSILVEKKMLLEAVKNLQTLYFEKKEIDARTFDVKQKVLLESLADIEKQLGERELANARKSK